MKIRYMGDSHLDDVLEQVVDQLLPRRRLGLTDRAYVCEACGHSVFCRHCPHDPWGRTTGELLRFAARHLCDCWVG